MVSVKGLWRIYKHFEAVVIIGGCVINRSSRCGSEFHRSIVSRCAVTALLFSALHFFDVVCTISLSSASFFSPPAFAFLLLGCRSIGLLCRWRGRFFLRPLFSQGAPSLPLPRRLPRLCGRRRCRRMIDESYRLPNLFPRCSDASNRQRFFPDGVACRVLWSRRVF